MVWLHLMISLYEKQHIPIQQLTECDRTLSMDLIAHLKAVIAKYMTIPTFQNRNAEHFLNPKSYLPRMVLMEVNSHQSMHTGNVKNMPNWE